MSSRALPPVNVEWGAGVRTFAFGEGPGGSGSGAISLSQILWFPLSPQYLMVILHFSLGRASASPRSRSYLVCGQSIPRSGPWHRNHLSILTVLILLIKNLAPASRSISVKSDWAEVGGDGVLNGSWYFLHVYVFWTSLFFSAQTSAPEKIKHILKGEKRGAVENHRYA